MRLIVFYTVAYLSINSSSYCQDSLPVLDKVIDFPTKSIEKVSKKAITIENSILNYSESALSKLEKEELRLKKKLARKDSLEAEKLFGDVKSRYIQLRNALQQKEAKLTSFRQYVPSLDTIKTSLNFISENSGAFLTSKKQLDKLQGAIGNVKNLDARFKGAEYVRTYISRRRAQLKQRFDQLGMVKELKKYNKQVYYYSEQIKEYRAILSDADKAQRKALELLTKIPAFRKFFREHSELAQLFPLPGGNGTPQSLAGLQTRAGVQSLLQSQLQIGGSNANQLLQQSVQQAQTQMNFLKDKVNKLGGGDSDMEMPDFKPNTEKAKSFWKRLELGTDFQNTRGNGFLPITTDFGLSVAYKLSERNSFGIGASYKMGWGNDIRNITVTHEGIGLRSFLDLKIRGGFFISGGYEQNYRTKFDNLDQLRKDPSNWMESGLIGLKKKYSIGKKHKGNLQLLYDFLHKNHVPHTQPVRRCG